jgi:hypothetical protein
VPPSLNEYHKSGAKSPYRAGAQAMEKSKVIQSKIAEDACELFPRDAEFFGIHSSPPLQKHFNGSGG